jgi:hypothetical protein
MHSSRDGSLRKWWHFGWAAIVVGALLLNVFWPVYPDYSVWALSLVAFPLAAALILANRPGNRVGRVLAVAAITAGIIFIGGWIVWTWQAQPWSRFLEAGLGIAVPVLFWGAIALIFVFPTGVITGRFARGVFVGFGTIVAGMAILAVVQPGPMPLTGRVNPLGGPDWIGAVYDAGIAVLVPGVVAGIWSFVARFRSSSPEVRSQMKWFLVGLIAVAGLVVVVGFVPERLPSPFEELTFVVVVLGFWAMPSAIVVAITRYRLYEIDRIISRTVSYTLVAATLGSLVAGVAAIAGSQFETPWVVAATTLGVAALFNPPAGQSTGGRRPAIQPISIRCRRGDSKRIREGQELSESRRGVGRRHVGYHRPARTQRSRRLGRAARRGKDPSRIGRKARQAIRRPCRSGRCDNR